MGKGPNESDDQPEEQEERAERPESPGLEQELEELLAQAGVDLDSLPLEDQVSSLKTSLEQAQQEVAENLDTAQRAQAEMVNFRRRTDEDRIANAKYANSRLIANILPVLEELDLAISHTESSSEINDSFLEGIKLIQRKLTGVLESEGVAAIEAVGLMFNPMEHEAVGTEESSEVEPGYITQILRPGFRLHDRVIRPAQVMVATAPKDPSESK
ncbi:MAG: nucleotide exchange factor GrpE [Chloroflexi bacterium]|jgi:molecular chaperone GrpE|nr:nucleotide exchange factor GrpE [Chloroflexota bacterium]MBJ50199.1 nucleotide exchange factor GrpE [Gammaproteobacteria bacterium]MQG79441.1 nucleotide exchange factor GrpE [SAR202 cluster bacterium]MAN95256.1 nucleotide exchange factor GrpE [Chloroflexota bacterium]MAQ53533.1 nucleotide exchange factor GrpE [Chloroflexota bacterium]|tara:strand:+ start:3136 stop:3777 length:642 start_codon:yes stop_codon:yes gene_type:complete